MGRKYLLIIYLMKDLYSAYVKNLPNSTVSKQTSNETMGNRLEGIFHQRIYIWVADKFMKMFMLFFIDLGKCKFKQ